MSSRQHLEYVDQEMVVYTAIVPEYPFSKRDGPTSEEVAEPAACRAIALKGLGLWQWWRECHAEFYIATLPMSSQSLLGIG